MPKLRYINANNMPMGKTLREHRDRHLHRRRKKRDYSYIIPSQPAKLDYLTDNREDVTVTWVGHSTFLIQYAGLNILTDPIWAKRMGVGKRLTEPGIPIEQVPPVDLILISHSHYDHMHIGSIRRLQGPKTQIVVPVGLKKKLARKQVGRCIELSWWEELVVDGVRITFVPTQHWTRRTLFDANTSHWGGFVLEPEHAIKPVPGTIVNEPQRERGTYEAHAEPGSIHSVSKAKCGRWGDTLNANVNSDGTPLPPTIYFAGDSGYFAGFKEIGDRFRVHITLMPIGAYEPEWFMGPQHMNPEQALQAFRDVGAEIMIPMHYGTFKLSDDTAEEALERLEQERRRTGTSKECVKLMEHGETMIVHAQQKTIET
ncbi:MBL fold metallo-hydrolase [Saccharibacillus sp. CPCC 101409]|uniref:MBL fold metallo-hydrolase n=1 Tax=Saccharibacillus sp. CPCC 101409 TaxID=3058041 RepID=UPI0026720B78|nr:MBL fold metallo-hydrolase [Saccharibacillus sp. CPCC 101409]MDO3412776.1 MBL fold metallo-hydrolase [Saccharibacillus sp. CPCC 101409]